VRRGPAHRPPGTGRHTDGEVSISAWEFTLGDGLPISLRAVVLIFH
jgi:hypothetical protein